MSDRIALRAGPLSMTFEPDAAFLRDIRLGEREVLRGIYSAVRDRHWHTITRRISNLAVNKAEDSFRLAFDVDCREREVHFAWHGTIFGDAQGAVTFTMDGLVRSNFLRNRIGLCVLHPIRECAGQPCVIEKTDGTLERGSFPYHISPHQPFLDMRAIVHELAPGLSAEVRLEGDTFEMEDQRNWTDASFKTYCTPLSLPIPAEVTAGTRIAQSVTLRLKGDLTARAGESGTRPRCREVVLTGAMKAIGRLPCIGLGAASRGQPLSARDVERLNALHLSHLRVDLNLSDAGHRQMLAMDAEQARALGIGLEVALFLGNEPGRELRALRDELERSKAPIAAWLVFDEHGLRTTAESARLVRQLLSDYAPHAKLGGGTDRYFAELNRNRPPIEALDFVCWSANPQVHTFDNTSMVQTFEGQSWTVQTARQFCGEVPVAVAPITLRPRATDGDADPRQQTLFAAAWTLGSIKALAEAGTRSLTYYETTGCRGVMEAEHGSAPGRVFPMYHVFADIGEFAGSEVIPIASSEPFTVAGLALSKRGEQRVIIANLTDEPREVTLGKLAKSICLRRLNEKNLEQAMLAPEAFRAEAWEAADSSEGALRLSLAPYEIVSIEASGSLGSSG